MRILLLFLLLSFFGCDSNSTKYKTNSNDVKEISEVEKRKLADSITKATVLDVVIDTLGVYLAPIKVTRAYLYKEEYSNYKSIGLTYKNVSGKRVEAIRFKWYGIDAFGRIWVQGVC